MRLRETEARRDEDAHDAAAESADVVVTSKSRARSVCCMTSGGEDGTDFMSSY